MGKTFSIIRRINKAQELFMPGKKSDNDGNGLPDTENMFENENSFNLCGLMDVTVLIIARWGSGLMEKGQINRERQMHVSSKDLHALDTRNVMDSAR